MAVALAAPAMGDNGAVVVMMGGKSAIVPLLRTTSSSTSRSLLAESSDSWGEFCGSGGPESARVENGLNSSILWKSSLRAGSRSPVPRRGLERVASRRPVLLPRFSKTGESGAGLSGLESVSGIFFGT